MCHALADCKESMKGPTLDTATTNLSILSRGLFDFRNPEGSDLLARCQPLADWVDESREHGLFPFVRAHTTAPDVTSEVTDFGGHRYRGINLASQDYLGLARHPEVVARAAQASISHGTHSSGSEPMGGGLGETRLLEAELGGFLGLPHLVLFPTGWGAGYGAIKALVRPTDHVLIDALAHDCLQHGARGSTPNVVPFAHNDTASLRKRLARVVSGKRTGGILVVTESLFSMDSDHPDFKELVSLCRNYGAALLVDVAHDLGVLGPGGRGVLAEQAIDSGVDVVVGSFSKTFACIGGFAATCSKAASYYFRGFSGTYTFSNFLIPSQVAAVRAALQIVRSAEGDDLRRTVLAKAGTLRNALARHGIEVLGRLSPIVLPRIGSEAVARLAQRRCFENGLILNSIEFPACRRGDARFRLQVTPRHDDPLLRTAADVIAEAITWAKGQLAESN
jgi:7-keto-8-aminopelargonate synthetase-like enzyme